MNNRNKHMDEPDKISEKLAGLRQKTLTGTLPEGYFEQLEEKVMSNIFLEGFKEQTQDGVPADYFNKLPDRVMVRLPETRKNGQVFLLTRLRWVAVAASMALVIFAVGRWNNSGNDTTKMAMEFDEMNTGFVNNLSSEDMEYLIGQFNSEEDLHLLKSLEQIDHQDLPQLKPSSSEGELLQDILTDEEIEYLNEIM